MIESLRNHCQERENQVSWGNLWISLFELGMGKMKGMDQCTFVSTTKLINFITFKLISFINVQNNDILLEKKVNSYFCWFWVSRCLSNKTCQSSTPIHGCSVYKSWYSSPILVHLLDVDESSVLEEPFDILDYFNGFDTIKLSVCFRYITVEHHNEKGKVFPIGSWKESISIVALCSVGQG